ncbi:MULTISPECIES: hypothetical protein [Bradyrhizobium]|jgi:hypothetical protein|uniref:hypothetical protein n=1 Tax=Bradyrhizobium TaxID=374 RepID=UPI0034E55B1F
MARKLKIYPTSLGFFDLAIAAPSMKAGSESLGRGQQSFHQGAAKESEDRDVIAATTAAPGVVLKRPVGSSGKFKEHELPAGLTIDDSWKKASDIAGPKASSRSLSIPVLRDVDKRAIVET